MIAVNAYGLTDVMQKDFAGTLRTLADIGFDAIEGQIVPKKHSGDLPIAVTSEESFPVFAKEAAKYGMTVPSVQVFNRKGTRFLPRKSVLRTIRFLRHECGVAEFAFNAAFTDKPGAEFWADYLSEMAEAVQGDDCRILFHNHDQELNYVDVGEERMYAMDYFFRLASPKVLLELDIGWAGNGTDEVSIAKQYSQRIRILHLKDFARGSLGKFHNPNVPKEMFTPIGEGEIRTREILDLIDSFPVFSGITMIDQDFSPGDILQDLRIGYRNVSRFLNKGV